MKFQLYIGSTNSTMSTSMLCKNRHLWENVALSRKKPLPVRSLESCLEIKVPLKGKVLGTHNTVIMENSMTVPLKPCK